MAFQTPPTEAEPLIKPRGDLSHLTKEKAGSGNIDDLLKELNTPREEIAPPTPTAEPSEQAEAGPDIVRQSIFDNEPETETIPKTPEEMKRAGVRTAKTVDSILAVLNGNIIAKEDDLSDYKATPQEIQDLGTEFAELQAKKGWEIPPEITLVIILIQVYLPKTLKAFENRRLKKVEDNQDKLSREIQEIKSKMKESD